MKKRVRLVTNVMVFLMVVFPVALVACGGGDAVEGVVDHKTVTGVINDTSYTILRNQQINDPDQPMSEALILVEDQDYSNFFSSDDQDMTITESLEQQLRLKYVQINYIVHVSAASSEGGTQSYLASREIFNAAKVSRQVKFETSGSGAIPKITQLLD